jgi:hypothetical protein
MLANITSFRDVYQANDSRLTTFDRSDVFLNVSQPPEGAHNLDAGTLAKLRIFSLTGNPTLGVVAGIRDAQGRTYIEVFHHFMCTVVHHARPWEEYDVVAAFKGIPGNPQDNTVIRFPRDWFLPNMETTQTPTEAELMGIEDPTTLAATYLLNPTVPLHNDRFVVIPPFLVETIGNAESKYDRPAILFNAINIISAKAAEHGDAQLQHATYRIVQFLWRLTTEAGAADLSIINETDLRTNDSHTLAIRAQGIERQWWGGKQHDPAVTGPVPAAIPTPAATAKDPEKQSWDQNLSERAAHMILLLSTQLNDAILEGGIRDIPLYCKDLIMQLERQDKPKPANPAAAPGGGGGAAPGPARGGAGGPLPAATKLRVDDQRVFNPTPLQEWSIKDNRLLNHIRTTMSRDPYEIDGTQVCIGYQCSGSCKKGVNCAYVSTHIPLTAEHKAGFGAWLQKARENFGNNNAKKPAE